MTSLYSIKSNPKIVQTEDELAVIDTGKTGHYLTLDSPYNNKQLDISPFPICMSNGEIITSTYTALLSKKDIPIAVRKNIIFQGSTRPCCQLEHFMIMDARP